MHKWLTIDARGLPDVADMGVMIASDRRHLQDEPRSLKDLLWDIGGSPN